MVSRYLITALLFLSLGVEASCLSEVCGAIEGLEMILIQNELTQKELREYRQNLKIYISRKRQFYNRLMIANSELEQLQVKMEQLDQKIMLSECAEREGSSSNCYWCIEDAKIYPDAIYIIEKFMHRLEQSIVSDIAEEKLVDSQLKKIVEICDEGQTVSVKACVQDAFAGKMPENFKSGLDAIFLKRRHNPNNNHLKAIQINNLLKKLRGGGACAHAASLITHASGGLAIRSWTLASNPLVDMELALNNCSPLRAMELIDKLYVSSWEIPWNWGQKEALQSKIEHMYRVQYRRAYEIMTRGLDGFGSLALGSPIYDCLKLFPASSLSRQGSTFHVSKDFSTCQECVDRSDLLYGRGRCKSFSREDMQKSRQDVVRLFAKELIHKDAIRRNKLRGDERFLTQIASDNPTILEEILASEGRTCLGAICSAKLPMSGPEPSLVRKRRNRLVSVSDRGGLLRQLKERLLGSGNTTKDLVAVRKMEKSFDNLSIEMTIEQGLTATDIINLGEFARNMPEMLEMLNKMKFWKHESISDTLKACGVRQ